MKNTTKNILSGLGVFFLGGLLINASASYNSGNEKDNEIRPVKGYNVYAVDLPTEVDFAGEKAPLHIPDVRERLDRELLVNTYWQSNGLLFIKRANRYFPVIERILKENGVPDDFKYLALIESGLQDVVSPAGASGFWQFMKAAAKENGLEITDQVDERYHLEKATKAACDYLKKSKKSMGSWTLAAAAYNAGNTGVYNQLTAQKVTDYYDLWLNSETSRYVFRILAIKEIMKNPTQYGFNFESKDLYVEIPTYQVEVKESIDDLALFAQKYGVNFKELKLHNSWLRSNKLTVTAGKSYVIKIPKK